MNENIMIRTEYPPRKAPPKTDPKMVITAKVQEWPPGEIINRDLEDLNRAADRLKDNICWLMECEEVIPVIPVNGVLAEVCGTVHNITDNINECNYVFEAVREAIEEEGGGG